MEVSGFQKEKMPFRYLGIPIYAKKISNAQCEALIEKMIARIRVWSTRNLSYMARVQLVNSVLLSLHSYWAQVFILPKKVLDEINKICRAFVWSGQQFSHKSGFVSWEQMCSSKGVGGMSFRNIIH